jgi:hypothetical protein
MEMLTEVMSLMLLNKQDAVSKYTGPLDKLDPSSKLPHPTTLKKKRKSRAEKSEEKAKTQSDEKQIDGREGNLRKAKPKSFEERLAEYEAKQRLTEKREQATRVQKLHSYLSD